MRLLASLCYALAALFCGGVVCAVGWVVWSIFKPEKRVGEK